MNEHEADQLAESLLSQYRHEAKFEVSLGDEHDYKMVREAFSRLGCRTGPDGEFFRLQVYPSG